MASAAGAAEILVTSDITVSTTWTANNTYNLQNQIYVKDGATLTIEAGTIVASTVGLDGGIAVARGSKIFVNGTATNPVIMTSKADVATWTGGNPKTGTWREAANEWGNLTIMGSAYISEDAFAGNVAFCDAGNEAVMEGLLTGGTPDPRLYGGGNDDDDSGTLQYLSLRYGGLVIGLGDELNALSLGGIGRQTDIHHVEVMNNVDDGIEVWGGTVNLKHISIWNVGDDSLDLDQGWRGQAQFGLIVQGYSLDAAQGSGVGDNCIEVDGAETAAYQPVTTAQLYNFTVIGQRLDGDEAVAYRDNARLQVRGSIFMDIGAGLVLLDDPGGAGGGYGLSGTLPWASTWTTSYTTTSMVNACSNPGAIYTAQTAGTGLDTLNEISDSVVFNVASVAAATAVGVFNAANDNVTAASMPITAISREATVIKGGKQMARVLSLDPRAANDAVASVGSAPNNGFYTPVTYRGAFATTKSNWLCGWTAADAFGMLSVPGTSAERNGGANLQGFHSTSAPNVGQNWTSTVDIVTPPGVVASIVAFGAGGPVSAPTGFGQLLCLPPFTFDIVIASGNHSVPIPNDCGLVGSNASFQGATFRPGDTRLQNAIDVNFGF